LAEDKGSPSLLELAREGMVTKKAVRCTIGQLLRTSPLASQIQELMDAAPESVSYATAAETLSTAVDSKIDGQTISRHQRKRCACS